MTSLATQVRRHVKRTAPTATVTPWNTNPLCERVIVSVADNDYEAVAGRLADKMHGRVFMHAHSTGKGTRQFIVEWQVA